MIRSLEVMRPQRAAEALDTRKREIQPFGPGRRHDVTRVAGKEQLAPPQRFGNEGPERGHRFLDRRSGLDPRCHLCWEPAQ